MTSRQSKEFQRIVLKYWKDTGRHALPWRKTKDPYKILISEIMLQQTQVKRVLSYYKNFLQKFPTVQALSEASLSDVLKIWTGLGYNRRAKYLRDTAIRVVKEHSGKFPKDYESLRKLPGVGDYTARAIRIFAFNQKDVLIETNIRTAFTHHFFDDAKKVHDKEILPLILEAARGQDPREWHWALMDYGASLKKSGIRLNAKSAHYVTQSPFEGSSRQLRGRILRRLMDGPISRESFKAIGAKNAYDISRALQALEREGLAVKEEDTWRIA